jgi:aarF domain-containing kinase
MFGKDSTGETKTTIAELLDLHGVRGVIRGVRALALYRQLRKDIDLLVDVHGHQIFQDASFNADPHPGNILVLSDGRLGLIDFGQTKKLSDKERDDFARVVVALGSKADNIEIAEAMRRAGFKSRLDADDTMAEYAALFFDSDFVHKEKGYATPQHYFQTLMAADPLINIPDSASKSRVGLALAVLRKRNRLLTISLTVMVARVSLLFRGAGSAINHQVQTSHNWKKHAERTLQPRGKT